MDSVYFLESSSSLEAGRHEELLERVPAYKLLFASQLEAGKNPDEKNLLYASDSFQQISAPG